MRATKKQAQKKHSWKKVFLFPEMKLFFFRMFFENRQQFNARAGQKKNTHVFFFGNAQPKSIARAHLKQRKKHSGLMSSNHFPHSYLIAHCRILV